MGKFLNKKAQTPGDNIYIAAFLFALVILIVVCVFVYNSFFSGVQTIPEFNQSQTASTAMATAQNANYNFDYAVLIIYIGLTIVMMILGYFIDVHSAFMVFYIIMIVFAVITAGIIGYVWDNFASTTTFYTLVTQHFPISNYLISNGAFMLLISSALSFIVTFGKSKYLGE